MDNLKPHDAKDVEAAVQWASGHGKTIEVIGQGTKRALGRPSQTDETLDLSGLTGVTLYEPEELVLSARAGTPMAEIAALVDAHGQQLAFEPMDYGPILGGIPGGGTIGGVLAANLSGPRRVKAGAARDHFLGVTAVSGRGETFKSGGRVVKNVTGYDICKVLAGSYGTLAVMTDVTVKTLPKPETEASVLILDLAAEQAGKAMAAAMGSACDVSGAAHLPREIAARVPVDLPIGRAATALRLEGFAPSVAHRIRALESLLSSFGTVVQLNASNSRAMWCAIRDVLPLASDERPLWRISVPPGSGPGIGEALTAMRADVIYDWAGGLIWAVLPSASDGCAAMVRRVVGSSGHATLVRASAAVRAAVDVFEPEEAGLAALTKRVKEGFDPRRILNPGRMWAGV